MAIVTHRCSRSYCLKLIRVRDRIRAAHRIVMCATINIRTLARSHDRSRAHARSLTRSRIRMRTLVCNKYIIRVLLALLISIISLFAIPLL